MSIFAIKLAKILEVCTNVDEFLINLQSKKLLGYVFFPSNITYYFSTALCGTFVLVDNTHYLSIARAQGDDISSQV
jgi:hypothetical protein